MKIEIEAGKLLIRKNLQIRDLQADEMIALYNPSDISESIGRAYQLGFARGYKAAKRERE